MTSSGARARWFSRRGGGIGRDRSEGSKRENHRNDERHGSGGGLVLARRRRAGPDVVAPRGRRGLVVAGRRRGRGRRAGLFVAALLRARGRRRGPGGRRGERHAARRDARLLGADLEDDDERVARVPARERVSRAAVEPAPRLAYGARERLSPPSNM